MSSPWLLPPLLFTSASIWMNCKFNAKYCGEYTFSTCYRLLLWYCDDRTYSYYIEVSTDKINWQRVVDKTQEACKWDKNHIHTYIYFYTFHTCACIYMYTYHVWPKNYRGNSVQIMLKVPYPLWLAPPGCLARECEIVVGGANKKGALRDSC